VGMTWICPECQKRFKNKNQIHSCARVDLEDHFVNKSVEVRATFDELMRGLEGLADITLNPVKTSIQVRASATFLSVKPKMHHVEIEFQMGDEVKEHPVYRTVRISKNRVLHFAILESARDVDVQVLDWLRQAYELSSRRS